MVLFAVFLIIFIFVLIVIFVVISHIKKSERQKCYAAAGNLLREEFLNYALQNTICPDSDITEPKSAKMMLCLKSKSVGKKAQFVFDPEKIVRIGRDDSENNIFINEASVSQKHCQIYSNDFKVFLLDLFSVNGTVVKRRVFKKYRILDGNQIELRTGDKIVIGSAEFKVYLFYYNLTVM